MYRYDFSNLVLKAKRTLKEQLVIIALPNIDELVALGKIS